MQDEEQTALRLLEKHMGKLLGADHSDTVTWSNGLDHLDNQMTIISAPEPLKASLSWVLNVVRIADKRCLQENQKLTPSELCKDLINNGNATNNCS